MPSSPITMTITVPSPISKLSSRDSARLIFTRGGLLFSIAAIEDAQNAAIIMKVTVMSMIIFFGFGKKTPPFSRR
jgi:hypothetical protein